MTASILLRCRSRELANELQFARYLAQEMQSSDHFGSSLSDTSDDDEEDGGWLAHSTFDLSNPPVSARHHSTDRRPLSPSGFDVSVVAPSFFLCYSLLGHRTLSIPRTEIIR